MRKKERKGEYKESLYHERRLEYNESLYLDTSPGQIMNIGEDDETRKKERNGEYNESLHHERKLEYNESLYHDILPGRLMNIGVGNRTKFLVSMRSRRKRSKANKDLAFSIPAALSRSKNTGRELDQLGASPLRTMRKKAFTLQLLPEHKGIKLAQRMKSANFKYNPIITVDYTKWKCDKYVTGLATHIDPSLDNIHHYIKDELLSHLFSALGLNRRGIRNFSNMSILLAGKVGWIRGVKFNMTTPEQFLEQMTKPDLRAAVLGSVLKEYCSKRTCKIYAGYEQPQETVCFDNLAPSFESSTHDSMMKGWTPRKVYRAFDTLRGHLLRIGRVEANHGDATTKHAVIHTRFDSGYRRIVNWYAVKQHLEARGFFVTVVHDFVSMDFREIASIMAKADLFIVPTGSSGVNMLMMKVGSSLIETNACCSRWSDLFDEGWVSAKRMAYGYMPSMECEQRKCQYKRDGRMSTRCGNRGNIECPTLRLDVTKIDEILMRFGRKEKIVDLGLTKSAARTWISRRLARDQD